MIVVSAASGEFGRLVVDQLLNRVPASDVAVAVRDVHKAAAPSSGSASSNTRLTDDLERVLGPSSTSLRAAVTEVLRSRS